MKSKFEAFLNQIALSGCTALDYRLTGDIVERLCVRHFHGAWRAVVAFRDPNTVVILLVGQHTRHDPGMDVYAMLYQLAGISTPSTKDRRKPPCCGSDALPPMWEDDEIDDLVKGAQKLAARR